jgi:hypothetical protein
MTFPDFLETRAGHALGHTFMGAVVGAIAWPLCFVFGLRYMSADTLERMTGSVFLCMDIEAAVLFAGVGFMRGTRLGPLPCTLLGFLLGILATATAWPLDLFTFYYPEGVAPWVIAVFIAAGTLLGLILGLTRNEEQRVEHDLSLSEIRRKSRRRPF